MDFCTYFYMKYISCLYYARYIISCWRPGELNSFPRNYHIGYFFSFLWHLVFSCVNEALQRLPFSLRRIRKLQEMRNFPVCCFYFGVLLCIRIWPQLSGLCHIRLWGFFNDISNHTAVVFKVEVIKRAIGNFMFKGGGDWGNTGVGWWPRRDLLCWFWRWQLQGLPVVLKTLNIWCRLVPEAETWTLRVTHKRSGQTISLVWLEWSGQLKNPMIS
jgi:hypothetical protein